MSLSDEAKRSTRQPYPRRDRWARRQVGSVGAPDPASEVSHDPGDSQHPQQLPRNTVRLLRNSVKVRHLLVHMSPTCGAIKMSHI